jgi:CARDB/Polysaccharide lyase
MTRMSRYAVVTAIIAGLAIPVSLLVAAPPQKRADLTITDMSWSEDAGISWSTSPVFIDNDTLFRATVRNAGTAAATQTFVLEWRINGTTVASSNVTGGLSKGQSRVVVASAPWSPATYPGAAGTYTALGVVDTTNTIAESNEGNNTRSASLVVEGGTTPPGPVWQSDAEISDLSQLGIEYGVWGDGSPGSTVTISTDRAHSGTRSCKLTTDNRRIEFQFDPNSLIQNEFYYSWWAYIPSAMGWAGTNEWMNLFQIEGTVLPAYVPIGKLEMVGMEVACRWQDLQSNQTSCGRSGRTLPRDQWVHFEWYTKIGTNGQLTAWMNGQLLWDTTGIDTSGLQQPGTSGVYFMNDLYGMNGTYYVDDLKLYNVNMNGTVGG